MLRHVTHNCIINFVEGLFPLASEAHWGYILYTNISQLLISIVMMFALPIITAMQHFKLMATGENSKLLEFVRLEWCHKAIIYSYFSPIVNHANPWFWPRLSLFLIAHISNKIPIPKQIIIFQIMIIECLFQIQCSEKIKLMISWHKFKFWHFS